MDPKPPSPPARDDDERVPLFGTWRRIYAAVVVCTLVTMALIALFSTWDW